MMTSRERWMAIYRGETPDRPAVKLSGVDPDIARVHPAYKPVFEAAMAKTDLHVSGNLPLNVYAGQRYEAFIETSEIPTPAPEWVDVMTVLHTPEGDLRSVFRKSMCRKPGYEVEYLLKEPSDIKRLLSLPYEPYPMDTEVFRAKERQTGERGVVMYVIDEAMYTVERCIGSENFALWSLEARDLLLEAMHVYAARIREHVERAFDLGLKPICGWVGPEACIPPLMSPTDFDAFVGDLDRPLCDLIHDRGGYVWVHCHGRMRGLLDRFAAMGVDVLNPIEPPPMGDITVADGFAIVGNRMGLEGGIQTHDIMIGTPEEVRSTIREALAGGNGQRYILCPSGGYMMDADPSAKVIENFLLYVEEGVRCAESMATL